jgi:hypothetical protein
MRVQHRGWDRAVHREWSEVDGQWVFGLSQNWNLEWRHHDDKVVDECEANGDVRGRRELCGVVWTVWRSGMEWADVLLTGELQVLQ